MRRFRYCTLILLFQMVFLATSGCGKLTYSDSGVDAQHDGPVPDMKLDASIKPDMAKADSGPPDMAVVMEAAPDSAQPDGRPDTAMEAAPDLAKPDLLKPDLLKPDAGTDGGQPEAGVVLVHGSIGTTASTGNSQVLLLAGTFEVGELVCDKTINTCVIGGIEP